MKINGIESSDLDHLTQIRRLSELQSSFPEYSLVADNKEHFISFERENYYKRTALGMSEEDLDEHIGYNNSLLPIDKSLPRQKEVNLYLNFGGSLFSKKCKVVPSPEFQI